MLHTHRCFPMKMPLTSTCLLVTSPCDVPFFWGGPSRWRWPIGEIYKGGTPLLLVYKPHELIDLIDLSTINHAIVSFRSTQPVVEPT